MRYVAPGWLYKTRMPTYTVFVAVRTLYQAQPDAMDVLGAPFCVQAAQTENE